MPTQVTPGQENAKVSSLSKYSCPYWECGRTTPWHLQQKRIYFRRGFAKRAFLCFPIRKTLLKWHRVKAFTKWLQMVELLLSQQSAGWGTLIFWVFGKHVTAGNKSSIFSLPTQIRASAGIGDGPAPHGPPRRADSHLPSGHTFSTHTPPSLNKCLTS